MMKRNSKKALAIVLASSMVFSTAGYTAFGASYSDTTNHWSEKQVDTWSDYGVISGFDGLFRPDDTITRGEMAVIIDRVMKYQVKAENSFNDLDQNFYTDPILKANNAGVMRGSDGQVRPKDKITREEAAVLMCQAFGLEPTDVSNVDFIDSNKVSSWAKGYVNALSNAGYITGKGDNDFDPQGYIKRGEAVTMLNNIVKGFYYKAGTYNNNVEGTVVVNTPDTILKDMNIKGDLIIAEGVGEGDLILDSVTVAGNVIVRGGGENSIIIKGNSNIGTVIVAKKDGNVSIKSKDEAKIDIVHINEGSKDVILEGAFGNVLVDASNVTVTAKGATIKDATITKPSSILIIDETSVLVNGTIAETATNSRIDIFGKATKISVEAPGSILNVAKGAKVDDIIVTETAVNAIINIEGEVKTIDIFAEGTHLTVGKDGSVEKVIIEKTATGVIIDGEGKIKEIEVNGNDAQINIKGSHVVVGKDVTGTVVDGKDITGGTDINPPGELPSGGGTGSGNVEEDVAVKGVVVSPETAIIAAGKPFKLTAKVTPSSATNKKVEWSSSNESIATVDADGVVTGVSVGEVTITATTKNGKKTGTSTITVKDAEYGKAIIKQFGFQSTLGTIDETNKTITIELPAGTDVSSLIATFVVSEEAVVSIGDVVQTSAVTKNDFTNPVVYTVKSGDGLEEVKYTVTVESAKLDFTKLNEAKAEAEILKTSPDRKYYKDETLTKFDTALKNAENLPETTQEEIDAKTKAIKDAIKLLPTLTTPDAPILTGKAPATEGGKGTIEGLTTLMEYNTNGSDEYSEVTQEMIDDGVIPGTYYVRIAMVPDVSKESPTVTVTVEDWKPKEYIITDVDDDVTETRTITIKDTDGVICNDFIVIFFRDGVEDDLLAGSSINPSVVAAYAKFKNSDNDYYKIYTADRYSHICSTTDLQYEWGDGGSDFLNQILAIPPVATVIN